MGEALLERRWPRKRERQRTGSAAVRRPRSEPSGGARAVMFCVANARHGVRRSVRVAGHFPMQSIYCPCVPGHHKVAAAVTTARVWRRAAAGAEEARRRIAQARVDGGYWIEALEQRRDTLEQEAAALRLEAHLRSEEAESVARAVRLARSQAWTPFDIHREAAALFFGTERRSGRSRRCVQRADDAHG